MQTSNSILDDLAKVASGAASSFSGIRGDLDNLIQRQLERLLADMDMVSRDEFEVVKSMAAKARAENDELSKRVAELEAQVAKPKKAAAKK